MRCLVVTAHPLEESLCATLTRRVVRRLTERGHDVVLEDLYAERFDAAMTVTERAGYYEGTYDTKAVQSQVTRLLRSQAIVFVFPTWWFGCPAVLKGWFDRVWVPGVADDHSAGFGPIKPRLHRLRETLVVTTLGAPWWVDRLILWQPLKRVLRTAIIKPCAPRCRFRMVSLYKSESLTSAQVDRFWARIETHLNRW
ncbi:NAD(P)H-dependent oxidoreductase [Desulfatitalea alkaliphila]|uniref:NAD(P)H-dependent oxidoreductase n=1 Tax=Desulfatitalea alkaliphila TaxID=2929485 RepID=A0AA41R3A9_9BACT|nr:NAD(P)H-dependent oxidoreductase [Desulfatitalea alkaliphila]MCJ8502352.1 NAD(P)H-dependent oxidoreductase [Desulfatitalea alkaliphila]